MAFRSMNLWKSTACKLRGNATYATSTTPKTAPAPTAAEFGHSSSSHHKKMMKGEFWPVYVALGMIALSVSLGLHTAKQQIVHAPDVRVRKKTRETLPEVEDPELVVEQSDKFLKKSFFRKVAHVQEFDSGLQNFPDAGNVRKDAYAHQPHYETLKSVGVDPKMH